MTDDTVQLQGNQKSQQAFSDLGISLCLYFLVSLTVDNRIGEAFNTKTSLCLITYRLNCLLGLSLQYFLTFGPFDQLDIHDSLSEALPAPYT